MGDVASFIAFCSLSFARLRQSWGTIIAFIEQPEVIEKILTHFGLWPAQSHSPPAGVPVAISPATGLIAA